jgi:hypothetical protein
MINGTEEGREKSQQKEGTATPRSKEGATVRAGRDGDQRKEGSWNQDPDSMCNGII